MSPRTKILGRLLVDDGGVRERDLEEVLEAQRVSGGRLGELLLEAGKVDGEALARALARQLALPYEAPPLQPDEKATTHIPSGIASERVMLPLAVTPRTLRLAMSDPLDLAAIDEAGFRSGRRIEVAVASHGAIAAGIRRAYGAELVDLASAVPGAGGGGGSTEPEGRPVGGSGSAPASQLLDRILRGAVEDGASDIHLEREEKELVVRERIDGVLRRVSSLPVSAHEAVLSRLKVLAGMDIAVRRRPQDGGFPLHLPGTSLNLRVSTLPVEGGEKGVIRILDPRDAPENLEELGFPEAVLDRLRRLIRSGQGVILAAGPTGSGKSSTLFGALGEVDREALNVVTLEDPVEYRMEGVSQVQVRPQAGLTFPSALRSVLRQDPDVVMIGEIRDRETAEIAMAAAVTGHLVLSSIHTTDAPSAVTRLLNMGVPPFLIAGGLSGVVAQRLVRRICGRCGGRGADCAACVEGYRGRTGIFQVLAMSDALRDQVMSGAPSTTLRRCAEDEGMAALEDDAKRKVAEGLTDAHEISRVLHVDPGTPFSCRGCGERIPASGRGCPACGRPRAPFCPCGQELRSGWRYCPACLRKAALNR